MKKLRKVAVYCGSRTGLDNQHSLLATELGRSIAEYDTALVYGAGGIGLMKMVADAVLAENGEVIGVITQNLILKEVQHTKLTKTLVVNTMHERKKTMFDLADAFIILPGGFGTLDEFFEILTWRILGLHQKPIILVESRNYWQNLINLINQIIQEGFADKTVNSQYSIAYNISEIFEIISDTHVINVSN